LLATSERMELRPVTYRVMCDLDPCLEARRSQS
jgi:hypothetical protein